ncbi:MAG TPA: helicase, partial [Ruminococcaceae bacterium]|nr:helicase [Oscillospiraceae bacterium]
MPVERLVNIDTGVEKLKIAYSKGKKWRELIMDKRTLASANSIISMADMGVAVTSENAKALVRYLSDIENINYDRIPERKSVGRLGYIEGEGFSPYVDGLIFDGDANFRTMFSAISTRGKSASWVSIAKECRAMSITARIMLAASFASVLVQPFGALPFFVHLWGSESGTGKTVALM